MKRFTLVLLICCVSLVCAFAYGNADNDVGSNAGKIYLYGEQHGVKKITDKELELWKNYYNKGMRDLFLELPYYTAEYLNIWLKENDDSILEEVFNDIKGTAFYNENTFNFFVQIKKFCPDTIFHGTDVGHQYNTMGKRFLKYLEANGQTQSSSYKRTEEIIAQGIKFYEKTPPANMVYREKMMVENFCYEFNKLNNTDVMGIYGSAHTGLESLDNTGSIPCMANQLKKLYKNLHSENLTFLAKDIEPIRVDKITVANKTYTAYYYGKQDLTGFKDFLCREFWKLDGAYDAFKNNKITGDYLPYNNYIMNVEMHQVYAIDYTKIDNTKIRLYYISDGQTHNGQYITVNISVE